MMIFLSYVCKSKKLLSLDNVESGRVAGVGAFANHVSCSSQGMECRRDKGEASTWAEQPRVGR